jgi:ABC-type multidrug transport system fused ATPase/permease subunit
VFGLASIIPIIKIASEPEVVMSNKYLNFVYSGLGFASIRDFLIFLIVAVFVFFIFKNIFILFVNYIQQKFIANVTVKIIDMQYGKYYQLPFWYFNNLGSSKILNHVNTTPDLYCSFLLQPLFVLFSEFMIISFIIIGVAIYQPVLFLILAVILGPTTYLIYSSLESKSRELGQRMDDLRPKTFSLLHDSYMGFVDLKLSEKQELFQKRYLNVVKEYADLKAIVQLFKAIPTKIIETIAILGIVLIFMYSLFISSHTENILTLLGLFVAAAYRLMPSINRILNSLMSLKGHQFTLENLEIYRDTHQHLEDSYKQQPISFNKSIVFDRISYSFPDGNDMILKDISLEVERGEKIGFIGSSGAGKTTLMNILLRFYKENSGSIKVDGIPLVDDNLKAWRKLLGYVRQDVFIMEGNILENITLGEKNIDYDRLYRSIEQASLRDFIDKLPQGLQTHVGEQGSKLSGGQKQRLGIARALYKKAEILVFDEATSALDNETEREVTEAIKKLSDTDITLFIVAHRITTLKDCDRIYEIKNGRLVGQHQYKDIFKSIM